MPLCGGTGSSIYTPTGVCIECIVEVVKNKNPMNTETKPENDPVNHPSHYTSHHSGVECIQITEHMSFCVGNAVKYLWRSDLKHEDALEDLKKARWYIDREIQLREKESRAKRMAEGKHE